MNNDPLPMTCDRLRELLVEHVDGLLGAAEAAGARSHLAACAPCRLLQEEVRRNFAAMDTWEDEELPAGAWERLEARLTSGPVPRLASGASFRATSAATATAAATVSAPRRSWIRVAVPYAAGLATAAAAALVFIFAPGEPPPLKAGPGPAPGAVSGEVTAAAPLVAERDQPPALRPGENRLRFEDFDNGVIRTVAFPGGLDPSKVMLVDFPYLDTPAAVAPAAGERDSGELVR